jgi:hypothetical protein
LIRDPDGGAVAMIDLTPAVAVSANGQNGQ